jgi:hypothetical protein
MRGDFQEVVEQLRMMSWKLQGKVIKFAQVSFDVETWLAVRATERQLSLRTGFET